MKNSFRVSGENIHTMFLIYMIYMWCASSLNDIICIRQSTLVEHPI